jgi:2-oxoisovalerate dehydrogenase E1 component
LNNFEKYLLQEGVLDEKMIEGFRADIKEEIETGLELAYAETLPPPNTELELRDMYAPFAFVETKASGNKTNKRMIDAISDGMRLAMRKHSNLVLMGQDIAEYGGVFKITEGFVEEFGKKRVRNTPLCESAIVGSGFGLSINGMKAMVEMQFADFVTEGFNQL